mmetsp:Transcript_67941/g.162230  ORF Transcript_67941/g.162230 Transcript_67941/m.162230 type:complete len:270 (+) Transcript_67941:492-1301(+)
MAGCVPSGAETMASTSAPSTERRMSPCLTPSLSATLHAEKDPTTSLLLRISHFTPMQNCGTSSRQPPPPPPPPSESHTPSTELSTPPPSSLDPEEGEVEPVEVVEPREERSPAGVCEMGGRCAVSRRSCAAICIARVGGRRADTAEEEDAWDRRESMESRDAVVAQEKTDSPSSLSWPSSSSPHRVLPCPSKYPPFCSGGTCLRSPGPGKRAAARGASSPALPRAAASSRGGATAAGEPRGRTVTANLLLAIHSATLSAPSEGGGRAAG